jgi:hypothetical protein
MNINDIFHEHDFCSCLFINVLSPSYIKPNEVKDIKN